MICHLAAKYCWRPQFDCSVDRVDADRGQCGNWFTITHTNNGMLMSSRKGKKTIFTSFGNGPDEQTMIRGRSDDQFVIVTGKAAIGTPKANRNRITRGLQLVSAVPLEHRRQQVLLFEYCTTDDFLCCRIWRSRCSYRSQTHGDA